MFLEKLNPLLLLPPVYLYELYILEEKIVKTELVILYNV